MKLKEIKSSGVVGVSLELNTRERIILKDVQALLSAQMNNMVESIRSYEDHIESPIISDELHDLEKEFATIFDTHKKINNFLNKFTKDVKSTAHTEEELFGDPDGKSKEEKGPRIIGRIDLSKAQPHDKPHK
jgi:hypothetical protein